jgi:chemotaxis protein CheC
MDALKEIVNIGIGKSAAMLNSIIRHHIDLKVPELHYLNGEGLLSSHSLIAEPEEAVSSIQLKFEGGFNGAAAILFPMESSRKLVNIVIEDLNEDFDALKEGALTEIGNILINGIIGSIGNILRKDVKYSIPLYLEDRLRNIVSLMGKEIDGETYFLIAEIRFAVESLSIQGDFILFFELLSFEKLLRTFVENPVV